MERITAMYNKKMKESIEWIKRDKERSQKFSSHKNIQMLQMGNQKFYESKSMIEHAESSAKEMYAQILEELFYEHGMNPQKYKSKRRYVGFDFCAKKTPYRFTIKDHEKVVAIRFSDEFYDESIKQWINQFKLDEIKIVLFETCTEENPYRDFNNQFIADSIPVTFYNVKQLFDNYFSDEEFHILNQEVATYLKEAKDVLGYTSVLNLSPANLSSFRADDEEMLKKIKGSKRRYQILDATNERITQYLYLQHAEIEASDQGILDDRYISNELFKAMLGDADFAKSFRTSEWLYNSLKGTRNYDYTSIISGYLKSIEQLLYTMVMSFINKPGYKVSLAKNKWKEAKKYNVEIYRFEKYRCVDFTDFNVEKGYMDDTLASLANFFIINNDALLVKESGKEIVNMMHCFRIECRNEFFHKHNLESWDVVEKTRKNAILLYNLILGSCNIDLNYSGLEIVQKNSFDVLCTNIRECRHFGIGFVFIYADGVEQKAIYDFKQDHVEYTDNGIEHYEYLEFIKVEEFGLESLEKIDIEGLKEEWKLSLTRDSMPQVIYWIKRNYEKLQLL